MAKKMKAAPMESKTETTEKLNDGYDGSKWSREEHQLDALSPGDHRSAKSKLGAERARPPVHFDSTLDR